MFENVCSYLEYGREYLFLVNKTRHIKTFLYHCSNFKIVIEFYSIQQIQFSHKPKPIINTLNVQEAYQKKVIFFYFEVQQVHLNSDSNKERRKVHLNFFLAIHTVYTFGHTWLNFLYHFHHHYYYYNF